jgi:hypothetical protein
LLESAVPGWYVRLVEVDAVRDAFFTIAGGGEIKATLNESPARTIENLNTILRSEEFSDLEPGNFQYIDLRFGTKVFVNEEPLLPPATSTATVTEEALEGEANFLTERF